MISKRAEFIKKYSTQDCPKCAGKIRRAIFQLTGFCNHCQRFFRITTSLDENNKWKTKWHYLNEDELNDKSEGNTLAKNQMAISGDFKV